MWDCRSPCSSRPRSSPQLAPGTARRWTPSASTSRTGGRRFRSFDLWTVSGVALGFIGPEVSKTRSHGARDSPKEPRHPSQSFQCSGLSASREPGSGMSTWRLADPKWEEDALRLYAQLDTKRFEGYLKILVDFACCDLL